MTLPPRTPGTTYAAADVAHLTSREPRGDGTVRSDYDLARVSFPHDPARPHDPDFARWRPDGEVVLEYAELPVAELHGQLADLQRRYNDDPAHRRRVDEIRRVLAGGAVAYPVSVDKHNVARFIQEGMHRAVAMVELDWPVIPAFLMKHRE